MGSRPMSILNKKAIQSKRGIRATTAMLLVGAMGFGILSSSSTPANAAPEPSPVATQWEFTFENGPMRLAWIDDGQGTKKPYFYFTYRVTNHWGGVKLFAPNVDLMADNANVIKSGQDVPSVVTDAIMGRLENPLLESSMTIVSNILQGAEHARDGIVIWPANDLEADEVTLFFAGLSGESETYIVGRESDDPHRYNLRKTLMLRFSTPGQIDRQGDTPFVLEEKRWVMR